MMLPGIPRASNPKTGVQTAFGGLNRNPGARDGALLACRDLTSDYYPVLASRGKRWKIADDADFYGNELYDWDGLVWLNNKTIYYRDAAFATFPDGVGGIAGQHFVGMGKFLYIWPMNWVCNLETGDLSPVRVQAADGNGEVGFNVTFQDGTLNGEAAAMNTVAAVDTSFDFADFFRPGDAVKFQGAGALTKNAGTHIIREIEGNVMRFNENTFKEAGTAFYIIGRSAPVFDWMCENGNRLWGVSNKDNTIYACKLGDPFNWFVYDGLASDSYAVAVGSKGNFTGCISYLGHPMFFKENHIYKMYGNKPSNFELQDHMTLGVMAGNGKSLAIAGETLFYNSRKGIMAYTGSAPRSVQEPLGVENIGSESKPIVAGSDGMKYYAAAKGNGLYIYDTRRGMWLQDDDWSEYGTQGADAFALSAGLLYMKDSAGQIWCYCRESEAPTHIGYAPASGMAELGDYYNYSNSSGSGTNRKYVTRLLLRVECENAITVKIMYDSSGTWQNAAEIPAMTKNSRVCSVPIMRCDHYRIKLESSGEWKLFSIAEDYVAGSGSNATVTV